MKWPLFAVGFTVIGLMAPAGIAGAAEQVIVIDKMTFAPVTAPLHVGDTIVWKNDDLFRHTATARDGSFDVDLPAHSEGRIVLTTPGENAFFCKFHPGMTGTLVVAP
jgi:plastocyanin